MTPSHRVIDVGGRASTFTDGLIGLGVRDISVPDLSQTALDTQKARLGPRGADVLWIVDDFTIWSPERAYDQSRSTSNTLQSEAVLKGYRFPCDQVFAFAVSAALSFMDGDSC